MGKAKNLGGLVVPADLQDQIDDLIIQYGKDSVLKSVELSGKEETATKVGRPEVRDAPYLIEMAMMLESDATATRWTVARQIASGLRGRSDDNQARRIYRKFKKEERYYRRYARKIRLYAKLHDGLNELSIHVANYKLRILNRLDEAAGVSLTAEERLALQSRLSRLDQDLQTIAMIDDRCRSVFNSSRN